MHLVEVGVGLTIGNLERIQGWVAALAHEQPQEAACFGLAHRNQHCTRVATDGEVAPLILCDSLVGVDLAQVQHGHLLRTSITSPARQANTNIGVGFAKAVVIDTRASDYIRDERVQQSKRERERQIE
jgi:hypothetical protein